MELYEILTRYRLDQKTKKAVLSGSHVILQDESGVVGFAQDVNKAIDSNGKPVPLEVIYGAAASAAILGQAALKDAHAKALAGKDAELAATNAAADSITKDKKVADNRLASALAERDEAIGLISQITGALTKMLKDNNINAEDIARLHAFSIAPAKERAAAALQAKIATLQAQHAEMTKG